MLKLDQGGHALGSGHALGVAATENTSHALGVSGPLDVLRTLGASLGGVSLCLEPIDAALLLQLGAECASVTAGL
ncbi:hypothetical protein AB4Y42_06100 [Paraburkholderia sp. EG286B]|uniref:hypothetical protein n=1 Tax=Paraburkholderia sp. EG286B TaxID=3237011 RepID=UPI0034D30353